MKNPTCPICGKELEYDELCDEANLFDNIEERYEGHCENCHKVFQWIEVYKPSYYYGMEEVSELE